MLTKNTGLLIKTKILKDNHLLIKLLTSDDIIISGLVFGGNSSKRKSIYQVGYFIEYIEQIKNINNLPSINAEISKPLITSIFDDKFKSFSILALISIVNIGLYEGQKISGIFNSLRDLIIKINKQKAWLKDYCYWSFDYLKLLGYEVDHLNNDNMKFFNLNTLIFQNKYLDKDSIVFPHELFCKKGKITLETIKAFFIIFNRIFLNNHLHNSYNDMPNDYIRFQKSVMKKLNK